MLAAEGRGRERAGFADDRRKHVLERRERRRLRCPQRSVLPPARSARWCRSGIRDRSPASSEANMSLRWPAMVTSLTGNVELAVLDPQPGRAAAVVAGDEIGAHADQVGDVEAVLDRGDQLLRARAPGCEMQVGRRRATATTTPRATHDRWWRARARAPSRCRGTRMSGRRRRSRRARLPATPSPSNGCERRPRGRSGSSTMRMPARNSRSPMRSFRKLVLRAIEAPLIAEARCPTSEPATRGS